MVRITNVVRAAATGSTASETLLVADLPTALRQIARYAEHAAKQAPVIRDTFQEEVTVDQDGRILARVTF